MPTKAINVTIDEQLLAQSDSLIKQGKYPNRSQFIQDAVASKLKQLDAEAIGEQAKLLRLTSEAESEEWLEGELESWQEKY